MHGELTDPETYSVTQLDAAINMDKVRVKLNIY